MGGYNMLISTIVPLDPKQLAELEVVLKDKINMIAIPAELIRFAISFTIACFVGREKVDAQL
jgi:hypothetical protein